MILITGTTGLVGTHLLAFLLQKEEVKLLKAIYRNKEKKESCIQLIKEVYGQNLADQAHQITWEQGDICDVPFLERIFSNVEYVYHCAGLISNAPSKEKELRKVNIEGTANLVNLSIDYQVKKFCHLSSISTLGEPINNKIISEENYKEEHGRASLYSISKYGGEMEVWRGTQEGLNAVILNPGVIIGEGFYTSGSGELIKKAYQNFPIYIDKVTGFVDVRDVVDSMWRARQSTVKNERFIIVSENRSLKEIQFSLASQFNKKKPKIALRKWMLVILIVFQYLLSFFRLTKRKMSFSIVYDALKNKKYSASKSIEILGVNYSPLDKSIERVCKHYLSTN